MYHSKTLFSNVAILFCSRRRRRSTTAKWKKPPSGKRCVPWTSRTGPRSKTNVKWSESWTPTWASSLRSKDPCSNKKKKKKEKEIFLHQPASSIRYFLFLLVCAGWASGTRRSQRCAARCRASRSTGPSHGSTARSSRAEWRPWLPSTRLPRRKLPLSRVTSGKLVKSASRYISITIFTNPSPSYPTKRFLHKNEVFKLFTLFGSFYNWVPEII